MKCKGNFCLILSLLIFLLTLLFNFEKGRSYYFTQGRRGYILDRKGEPLVINKESFQAYYLIKGKSFLGEDFPKEIKPYLPKILDLPEKGLILLSENLTLDEVQRLSKVKNVSIRSSIERKVLNEGIRSLLGETTGDKGLLGLEKVYDYKLQRGESIITSLDMNLLKRVYSITKAYASYHFKGMAQFKLTTGELISYWSLEGKDWLTDPLFLQNDLPFQVPERVSWELGSYEVIKQPKWQITPLHLVFAYLNKSCGVPVNPTLIYKKEEVCSEIKEKMEELFLFFPENKSWVFLYPREGILYVLKGEVNPSQSEFFSWEKFTQNLKYIVEILNRG